MDAFIVNCKPDSWDFCNKNSVFGIKDAGSLPPITKGDLILFRISGLNYGLKALWYFEYAKKVANHKDFSLSDDNYSWILNCKKLLTLKKRFSEEFQTSSKKSSKITDLYAGGIQRTVVAVKKPQLRDYIFHILKEYESELDGNTTYLGEEANVKDLLQKFLAQIVEAAPFPEGEGNEIIEPVSGKKEKSDKQHSKQQEKSDKPKIEKEVKSDNHISEWSEKSDIPELKQQENSDKPKIKEEIKFDNHISDRTEKSDKPDTKKQENSDKPKIEEEVKLDNQISEQTEKSDIKQQERSYKPEIEEEVKLGNQVSEQIEKSDKADIKQQEKSGKPVIEEEVKFDNRISEQTERPDKPELELEQEADETIFEQEEDIDESILEPQEDIVESENKIPAEISELQLNEQVGERINLPILNYAPLNEKGVILLFGYYMQKLGISHVEEIKAGFPDVIAIRSVGNGKYQRIRIAFEFKSSFFTKKGHYINECDLIICWKHDWKNCPIEVIELSKVLFDLEAPDR